MKKTLVVAVLSTCLSASALADGVLANSDNSSIPKAGDILTGDTRLACEAILCLSTGSRPSECNPSIKRYFSIKHDKMGDTIIARRDFLQKCPTGNEEGMPQLINAIANGAGRCDAAALNKRGYMVGGREDRRFVVNTQKPDYCKAYENHEWTRIAKTKLEPIYCERQVGSRWGKKRTEKYQCGQKWVDVPAEAD